jgi:NADPH2:quinone reductase
VREHAVEIDRYGGPEELVYRAVSRPSSLGERELRIRTRFAAVNRADIEIRRGAWPIVAADPFPYTPGLEVVGEVCAVGSSVTGLAVGERVITMMQRLGGIWGERPGGYGEFVVVDEDACAAIPDDLDLEHVAALGLVAVTAASGLRRLALSPGERVVVHGASGGVGSAAVAMAHARGCEVVAVLPRPGKDDYVRSLGASTVVHLVATARGGEGAMPDVPAGGTLGAGAALEPGTGPLVDALGARSVDAVLETTGERTFADSCAVLRRGGRLCLVGALTGPDLTLSAWDLIQELQLTGWSSENLDGDGLRASIAAIVEQLRAGTLRAPAVTRFDLADVASAHRAMERGKLAGRALLVA